MYFDVFKELCKLNGLKVTPTVKKLGFSPGAIGNWKNGAVPNGQTLIKVADYFNVTPDYLLGKTDKKEKPTDKFVDEQSEQLERINEALRDLPDEAAAQVLAYAELLKLKYKK